MNEFWLWFWRPIAEFLGALAFIAAIVAVAFVGFIVYLCFLAIQERWRKFRSPSTSTAGKEKE